ncbi:MAG: hypothetical protein KA206_05220 [Paludibacter sp.]|nr:hypothetical protein [Paludibacter sp.]
MRYTYEINPEGETINVVTIGHLETKELADLGLKILLKAKELKYRIIFDCRQSRNKITIAEAYYWYATHYDHIDIVLRNIPIAYIVNKEDWNFYSFFECTCMNQGIQIKVFQEEADGLNWIEKFKR